MELMPYLSDHQRSWDAFVRRSRNGTFLFERAYMDYHAHRFEDASIMLLDQGAILALLPASRHGEAVKSHGGLTYGGLIIDGRMRTEKMLQAMEAVARHFGSAGVRRIEYKVVPHIYHAHPSEEDRYALFRLDARLMRSEPSSTLPLCVSLPGKKLNGAARARRNGLAVRQVHDSTALIAMIDQNLRERHGTGAVHSATEMNLLQRTFPNKIEFFHVLAGNHELVGGAIVYLAGPVAHTQYLVVSAAGRPLRAMDLLISALAERYREHYKWLDFGISSEQGGQLLNARLISQKEEFGARCIAYETYELIL